MASYLERVPDWDELDYLDDTSWLRAPALVWHGTGDLRVPVETSEGLAEARPDLVDLVVTPDAVHVASWNADPQRYEAHLASFLESVATDEKGAAKGGAPRGCPGGAAR